MDRPDWVTNATEWQQDCLEIVNCTQDLLSGRCGVIESARVLWRLSLRVRAQRDPDFVTFCAIDSESDALPIGPERENWAREALKREDAKISSLEARWRPRAITAAGSLLKKYSR